ncbi:MAG: coniferyl aldehyde dehydrogenase [Deltaproteobacteria bacterium]|nr:coniferyl aldehyde dehydrogenase [Deltaproteobacteria bacterium]
MSATASVVNLDSRRDDPALVSLRTTFQRMHVASRAEPPPSIGERKARLDALDRVIRAHRTAIADACHADFGSRSRHETLMADVFPTLASLQHTRKHLRAWSRPRKVAVHWAFQPGSARIVPQPLGVIGIIAPWNYPVQLALSPLVAALAAGNRAILKPSELTPRTSELLAAMMTQAFDPAIVAVAQGGVEVAEAFSRLPFDHILFTGSTRVGALVMKAAAEHLTPVTLELGGKSPAIVHESYPLELAAERIMAGKLLNAGQTCIAPDYVLVPRGKAEAFAQACAVQVAKGRPTLADNPDYTAVVNDRQYQRLQQGLDDARNKGARLIEINPANEVFPAEHHKLPPTLVLGATDDMVLMQEEIFGPVLPILEHGGTSEAIAYVNARPRPLALYYFDRDSSRIAEVTERTTSGGVTINDTILHIAQENLPFGGVGPAGMGAYHGQRGFDTLSHCKGVFQQSRINGAFLMNPPYGPRLEKLINLLT